MLVGKLAMGPLPRKPLRLITKCPFSLKQLLPLLFELLFPFWRKRTAKTTLWSRSQRKAGCIEAHPLVNQVHKR